MKPTMNVSNTPIQYASTMKVNSNSYVPTTNGNTNIQQPNQKPIVSQSVVVNTNTNKNTDKGGMASAFGALIPK